MNTHALTSDSKNAAAIDKNIKIVSLTITYYPRVNHFPHGYPDSVVDAWEHGDHELTGGVQN